MDLAIADRYEIPRELVWFNRQAFEADMSASSGEGEDVYVADEKTTEDLWTELLVELDVQRADSPYTTMMTLSPPSASFLMCNESMDSSSDDEMTDTASSTSSDVEMEPMLFEMEYDDDFEPQLPMDFDHDGSNQLMPTTDSMYILPAPLPTTDSMYVQPPAPLQININLPALTRIPSTTSTDSGYIGAPSPASLSDDEDEETATVTTATPPTSRSPIQTRASSRRQLWPGLVLYMDAVHPRRRVSESRGRRVTHRPAKHASRQC
ncbi:uncharacterized protein [Amphiura filiformis]|uniref:uncharacterized protein n=1 Tax=Amphiura filiformis TaxID=82378 RepID=UPI003B218489